MFVQETNARLRQPLYSTQTPSRDLRSSSQASRTRTVPLNTPTNCGGWCGQLVPRRWIHYPKLKKRWRKIEGWRFSTAFPDLDPASGGQEPLSVEAWAMVQESMGLHDYSDYVKAILNKHDGEAKLVFDDGWLPLTELPNNPQFWDYQFATDTEL